MKNFTIVLVATIALVSCSKEDINSHQEEELQVQKTVAKTKLSTTKSDSDVSVIKDDTKEELQYADFRGKIKRIRIRKRPNTSGYQLIAGVLGTENFTEAVPQLQIRIDGFKEDAYVMAFPDVAKNKDNGYTPRGVSFHAYGWAGLKRGLGPLTPGANYTASVSLMSKAGKELEVQTGIKVEVLAPGVELRTAFNRLRGFGSWSSNRNR